MSFQVSNNPLISFKLANGKLIIFTDTDINDLQRKAKFSVVQSYKDISALSLKFDGFDNILEKSDSKFITGKVKILLTGADGNVNEVLIADQLLELKQKSKFKRKNEYSLKDICDELRKLIHDQWNETFYDALSTLADLERSQQLPGPIEIQNNQSTVLTNSTNLTTTSVRYVAKKDNNPLLHIFSEALQSSWSKIFISLILVFALIQMVIAVSSNAIDVKNKKMEGEVFNTISNNGTEDEAVKRVLKDMGIERNTDKNDLGCFVE